MGARCIFKQDESRSVGLAEFAGNVESQAGTGRMCREKWLENLATLLRIDAFSIIENMQTGTVGEAIKFADDADCTTLFAGVAQCVAQQIGDHPMQMAAIEAE
jgi:hypothetical protein